MASIVAIDGPAGSGKSTVAKEVAKRLGFLYIDTGAMYRALTLKAINEDIDFKNRKALIDLSQNTEIKLEEKGDSLRVYMDGKDVTEKIRSMEVTKKVKLLAPVKEVRENMVILQRRLSLSRSGSVVEGRDIATVVFPDAKNKIYLDADVKTRAKRRFTELKEKWLDASLEDVKKDVICRDESDMKRKIAPLKKANDAVVIDTTDMTIEEVVKEVLKIVKCGT